MFQWKSIESMKRGDLLATTSDSALNPIIHFALSLSLSLSPSPSLRRAFHGTEREREKDVCNVARACTRKKQTACTPPRARTREKEILLPSSQRSVQRGLSWSASDKATIVALAQSSLLKLFTGGGKKSP